ncbi:hypothetical protein K9N68_39275 (plasmid) [Kovacikia minuta CCNUW1]|uniref:hypothetical protein n=1 Tax=Kovacikia minuta TaxID=2931930 RepID=UPI001CCD2C96|nr:hypothetical protein [Kovacikia minuta]UBF30182.1 hypothetical protein K9N68_39275 [Kovacikia minuta CCNUW1]
MRYVGTNASYAIEGDRALSVPGLVIATEGAIEFSHGLTVSKSAIDDLLGQGALFARSSTSGESEQTRRGKEYHRDMVAGRRASGDYNLVNQVMKDKAGNVIEVPYRVDVETGQPLDTRIQRVLPDAVNFEKGLIIDDKPLGRNVLSGDDRQEMIRNITAFKIREGKLPKTIEIHRYDLKTGKPAGIEVYTPEQFLPTNSQ